MFLFEFNRNQILRLNYSLNFSSNTNAMGLNAKRWIPFVSYEMRWKFFLNSSIVCGPPYSRSSRHEGATETSGYIMRIRVSDFEYKGSSLLLIANARAQCVLQKIPSLS